MNYTQSRLLPYRAQALFELVLDIESYPAFVPGVRAASVQLMSPEEGHLAGQLQGILDVGHGMLGGQYTSLVTFAAPQKEHPGEIRARSDADFFKMLEAHWSFHQVDEKTTRVEFTLDMELKSWVLQQVVNPLLPSMCLRALTAFEARAGVLYGSL